MISLPLTAFLISKQMFTQKGRIQEAILPICNRTYKNGVKQGIYPPTTAKFGKKEVWTVERAKEIVKALINQGGAR